MYSPYPPLPAPKNKNKNVTKVRSKQSGNNSIQVLKSECWSMLWDTCQSLSMWCAWMQYASMCTFLYQKPFFQLNRRIPHRCNANYAASFIKHILSVNNEGKNKHTHTQKREIILHVFAYLIITIISIAPYLTNMGECTVLYKTNNNVFIKTSNKLYSHIVFFAHHAQKECNKGGKGE